MDYRILGPLVVWDGDRAVTLGGDKQRALLAILLLHANEVVSADRLIDDLWGEQPPPTALKTLQAYVSRLRKTLDGNGGPSSGSLHGMLLTRGHGYVLRIESGELDVERFRGLIEQGRQALALGEADGAAKLLREGLALWRGPPLGELTYEAFAAPAVAQLEELRLGALEERIDADLALGRQRNLVGELAGLVERHPLRERLRGQLMLAVYRCGRQAEALEVYQEFRRSLSEQLGLDPSPGLRQLEAAILNQDPTLDAAEVLRAPDQPTNGAQGTRRASLRRRRLWFAVSGSVLLVAVLAAVLMSSGGGSARLSVIAADSVGAISPARGTISAEVPVGSSPAGVAAGERAVWVANYDAGTVSRIDPATHAVVQTIAAGSTPSGIAVGAGAVWVANNFSGTVSRIDPSVNRIVQTIPVGNGPAGVAVGNDSVWVTNSLDGTLSRINAITGVVVTTALGGATDVAVGLGAVWVSDEAGRRVWRIDPATNHVVQAIDVGTGPGAITVGYGSVWVANSLDGTVSRIVPQTNQIAAAIPVGDGPAGLAVGAGGVWVANEFGGRVVRIDPTTNTVARTVAVGNRPRGLAAAAGLLWVSTQASAAAHRGGTLTVLENGQVGSLDPARPGSLAALYALYVTNDGLTAFKHVGGSDGAQLVPDLAVSLPAATDGGLTYTFQLRPGIRYSNGQPVRPEDFRRAIERDFPLGPGAPLQTAGYTYFENLVGAAPCVGRPTHCDLSRGIVTDEAAHTVTFHLVRQDPEFPAHLALLGGAAGAVPATTSDHSIGNRPLPATGPYEVSRDTPREVRLVRNPYFHEWSHAAQPDGYPDRIVLRTGGTVQAAVSAVERGKADYTIDPPPADRLREVHTRFASQLNIHPTDETIFIGLNTRARPFKDIRVRRALSYAVDRAELTRLLGQESHPICQMLPPYVPGHQPYCPYTLNSRTAGVWRAPDLRKARALIAASGTRGTPITIWNQPGFFTDFTATGRYVASLLQRLGYPTRIKPFSVNDTTYLPRLANSRSSPQAYFYMWGPNYPAASEFLGPQYWSCQSFVPNSTSNNNLSAFCDRRFDATVRRAFAAEAATSPTAAQVWAEADRRFTDEAPIVNIANPSQIDLVSRRVSNFQYNPQVGVLLDQLWVR